MLYQNDKMCVRTQYFLWISKSKISNIIALENAWESWLTIRGIEVSTLQFWLAFLIYGFMRRRKMLQNYFNSTFVIQFCIV